MLARDVTKRRLHWNVTMMLSWGQIMTKYLVYSVTSVIQRVSGGVSTISALVMGNGSYIVWPQWPSPWGYDRCL